MPPGLDAMASPLPFAAKTLVAVTRVSFRDRSSPEPLDPLEYQRERWRRIKVHQEQHEYLCKLRDFLKGEVDRFAPRRLRKITKVADLFALDARGVLYRLAQSTRGRPRDAQDELRLVVPTTLRADIRASNEAKRSYVLNSTGPECMQLWNAMSGSVLIVRVAKDTNPTLAHLLEI
ncbi:hypothetical protein PHMEG_0002914 [Phytophthora megakarya]|uniref:Reverse transcriptase n=1 Tax=Phytophthora megakarya TaxID=4795 RepID=A0A225WXQ9_9STRA|nr:hypothetical protein PHMEG_0002914 [Phytophthora megakarya]